MLPRFEGEEDGAVGAGKKIIRVDLELRGEHESAVVVCVIAFEEVGHGSLGRRSLDGGVRIDDRGCGVEAGVRNSPDADLAIVAGHVFQEPVDRVGHVGTLVGIGGAGVVKMRAHVDELALGLVATANVLEHKNVSGFIEGLGWAELTAIRTFPIGKCAEWGAHDQEWMGLGGVFGRVHLGKQRDSVAHGDADFALGIVCPDEGTAGSAQDNAPANEGSEKKQRCQDEEANERAGFHGWRGLLCGVRIAGISSIPERGCRHFGGFSRAEQFLSRPEEICLKSIRCRTDLMRFRSLFPLLMLALAVRLNPAESQRPWVSLDSSGKLVYRTLPRGDHIVDFSYAGYMGGGVPLPNRIPIGRKLAPSGADDTAAIQRAIDEVSALPLKGGFRGAVVLAPGTFLCSGTLNIAASGIVLHGSGPTEGGTTLKMTGDPHVAIAIAGKQEIQVVGTAAHIADAYVPSGAQSITLDDASAFAAGDSIRITRYTTPKWLHLMGMDRMERDGKDETWVGSHLATVRTVTSRKGNVLTLDVPLTDSYDRAYLPPEGAEVAKVTISGTIEQDAVESLHIDAPPREVAFTDPLFRAINLSGLRDGWIRDLLVDDTTEGIDAAADTSRITIVNVVIRHTTSITSSAKPADFVARGTQLLILRCGATGNDRFYMITGPRNQGPNVVLDSEFHGDGHIQPHQRWATGFLVDNTRVPGGGIDMMNRGEMGSGHGWTMGWGVVWNSAASSLVIQNPPGAANWSIGNSGSEQTAPMKIIGQRKRDAGPDLPLGFIESPNHAVVPASLYREQLAERLGPGALKALEP